MTVIHSYSYKNIYQLRFDKLMLKSVYASIIHFSCHQ